MLGERGVTILSSRTAYADALAAACERSGIRASVSSSRTVDAPDDVIVLDLEGANESMGSLAQLVTGSGSIVVGLGGTAACAEELGLAAWVSNDGTLEDLLSAIAAPHGGPMPRRPLAPDRSRAVGLTQREREVLGELLVGGDTVAMAARLAISPRTLTTHIQRVFAKLGVNSRAQAAAWALRSEQFADGSTRRAAS